MIGSSAIPQAPEQLVGEVSTTVTWCCALSSLALLVTILTMAAHVRFGLGHWPTPMLESYDTPLLSLHELGLVIVGYFCVLVAPPLWFVTSVCGRFVGTKQFSQQLGVYAIGWALIFLAGFFDPTTFTEWLLD